jgi:dTDP-4-dehydrorhamnose reductase
VVVGATQEKRRNKVRVLVTGANGQLGSEVVAECLANGDEVIPMTREDADLADLLAVGKFIQELRPTHIIHCAAMTGVDKCETYSREAVRINTLATDMIVRTAYEIGAHVTYISTDYVFSGRQDEPYVESDSQFPINKYGITKKNGELVLRPTDAIVRVSWLFGPNGNNIVKTVLNLCKTQDELRFVDDQIGNPTYAPDAARVISKISRNNMAGIFHVTNEGSVSWYEFVRDLLDIAEVKHVVLKPVSSVDMRVSGSALRPKNSVLANTRLTPEAGFEPMPHYRNALQRMVDELAARGSI